jgi:hypothetical protein
MSRFRLLFSFLLIATLLSSPGLGFAQSKPATKASKSNISKKVGFSGDPARKRGMEIGFDMGKKAGNSDKEQALKPDLKRHEAYQKPEKYYRSEYGSSASFASGFRSGFSGGYQTAFGKKVKLSTDGLALPKTPKTPTPKKGSAASDAL